MDFNLCLSDARKLIKDGFLPEIDNLENHAISEIMFKVLVEHDLMEEGELGIIKSKRKPITKRVKKFIKKWTGSLDAQDQLIYTKFLNS